MVLNLATKKEIVTNFNNVVKNAVSAGVAEYRGLTVSDMTQLRIAARETGIYLRVIRNTLASRAVEGTQHECLQKVLSGPVILAFTDSDPGAPARLFRTFSKTNEKLVIKAFSVGGQLLDASHVEKIAALPTRQEALTKLVCVLKAPITKFVRTLAEPYAKMVRVLAALRDQKKEK